MHRLRRAPGLGARLAFENRRGLSEVYNESICNARDADSLVFVHDDVWLEDYFLCDRVAEGLRSFDVIGVAGNRRRLPRQPSWAFVNTGLAWDDPAHLSGSVAHGPHPFGVVNHYGPTPAACELLDGVFLATSAATLKRSGLLFDTRFSFHFYDLDFCRTARKLGLGLGTWPVCITHQSRGAFGSPQWAEMYRAYLDKWGD